MYEVLVRFIDGESGKRWPREQGGITYSPGDEYPKGGFEPTDEHIEYLLSPDNKLGKPVIRRIGIAKEPSKMTKDELVAFAAENGIELGEAKNKPDILAVIEEALKE